MTQYANYSQGNLTGKYKGGAMFLFLYFKIL